MLMLDPASILMLEVSRGLLLRFQTGNAGDYVSSPFLARAAVHHYTFLLATLVRFPILGAPHMCYKVCGE